MTQPAVSPDKKPLNYASSMKLAAVGGQVGCLTLFIVLTAVFGGLWLDQLLGTKPILTILLVLGSAPLSLFLTFWLAMRAVKDVTPPSTGAQAKPIEEEESSE